MFEFGFDLTRIYFLSHIEATCAGTCITFFTDIFSGFFFFLVFIKTFGCLDGHITIFQRNLYFIFGKSRKIYFKFISIVFFFDIGFHHMSGSSAVQFFLCFVQFLVGIERKIIIKKVIKQILSKNTRHQHKSSLLFIHHVLLPCFFGTGMLQELSNFFFVLFVPFLCSKCNITLQSALVKGEC